LNSGRSIDTARHLDRTPAFERGEPLAHDRLGVVPDEVGRFVLHLHETRRLVELGVHEAGAQRADLDARAAQLERELLGERHHVGLGRSVVGARRPREARGERRDIEYTTEAALDHRRHEAVTHLRHTEHHQLEELRVLLPVGLLEQTRATAARVVDQVVDGDVLIACVGFDRGGSGGLGQVGAEGRDTNAVLGLELARDLLELVLAPRDEQQVEAPLRELTRELHPQARRRAGDQCRSSHTVLALPGAASV
jgi:hypothetical protein